MDLYELVRGPLAWISLSLFFGGCVFRFLYMILVGKKEKKIYPLREMKDGFRSVLHGVLPFGTAYMRRQPLITILIFIFHFCMILLPVFLLTHIVLWYESWEILWWSLPDIVADLMTILVISSCIIFLIRRLVVPEVKHVTQASDFLFLFMILLPFITGFLASHQWGPYRPFLILHVLSGEMLLIAIPFTRLSHMFLFPFTRGHMGSEFGNVLNARDW